MSVDSGPFLMVIAEIAGTLIGTFIVGVFFYLDSVGSRSSGTSPIDHYMRAAVRWVFIAYSLPLLLPLVLIWADPIWGAAVFVVLGSLLVAATVGTVRRMAIRGGAGASMPLILNEWITTVAVLVVIVLPWLIGGWIPPASAYSPSLVIMIAAGFASTAALITSEFDSTIVVRHRATDPSPDDVHGRDEPIAGDAGGGQERSRRWSRT